jgi:hypothetical protein
VFYFHDFFIVMVKRSIHKDMFRAGLFLMYGGGPGLPTTLALCSLHTEIIVLKIVIGHNLIQKVRVLEMP